MATFNGEKYIIEQLQSIFNQTMEPDEVIICDDGSTDNTVELIENFIIENKLNKKWKLFKNKNNLGFVNNFKKAISLTNGDIIFLSDQDDIFMKNKFEVMFSYFLSHEKCVLLSSNYIQIDEKSKVIKNFRNIFDFHKNQNKRLNFKYAMYHSSYPGFAMAFRRNVAEELLSLDVSDFFGHDIALELIALNIGEWHQIKDVLSAYRLHNMNTSGSGTIGNNVNLEIRIRQKENELKQLKMLDQFCRKNRISIYDYRFMKHRYNELLCRIQNLKKNDLRSAIFAFLFFNAYPKKTLLGDIYMIMK